MVNDESYIGGDIIVLSDVPTKLAADIISSVRTKIDNKNITVQYLDGKRIGFDEDTVVNGDFTIYGVNDNDPQSTYYVLFSYKEDSDSESNDPA
jgi:hypothetical protein